MVKVGIVWQRVNILRVELHVDLVKVQFIPYVTYENMMQIKD